MDLKKVFFISLVLLMVFAIGQVSASEFDTNDTDILSTIDDYEDINDLNQINEIDTQEDSSIDNQDVITSSNDEILSDYTPDANGIYVSPEGSDEGEGTYESPYQTIPTAINSASNGKTIYLAGGTYYISSSLSITKSLNFVGYDGTAPVIDAQKSCRILDVKRNDYNLEFSFTNVTLAHGSAAFGGVMYAGGTSNTDRDPYFYGKAYFTNCTFLENEATGTGNFNGGGVFHIFYNAEMAEYNTDGDWINCIGCAFINNTAATGSIFRGSGMGAPTFKYCIAIGNSNIMFSTNNGRNYEIKDSYWESNSPTGTQMNVGSMDYGSNAKLTIISDVDEINLAEQAIFTAKLIRSNGADYGNNINFADVPITFTVTSGTLSETYTVMANKKGIVTFTPSLVGEVTVTATLGSQSVSKTINVVPLPLYISASAVDGEGDGSLENPYSFADAMVQVNAGNSAKVELLEGNYTINTVTDLSNNLTICPYKTSVVNIAIKDGFLNIASDLEVNVYNLTIYGMNTQSNPVFRLGENSKVDIQSSIIRNNKATMGTGIVAIVGTGATLNIENSQIYDNTAMMSVDNMYGTVFDNKGTVTANNNWWGSNTLPTAGKLYITNAPTINSWYIIQQTQDKTMLRTEWSSIITTKLVKNDGSAITGFIHNLTGAYSTNTGSLSDESFVLSQDNGYVAKTTLSGATEAANVVSTVTSQSSTSSFEYEVPLTEIYVSLDGDDENGDGSINAPFKTIPRAVEIAKEAGCIIYLKEGTYDGATVLNKTPDRYSTILLDNRNLTITSYGGPVVIDRTHSYGLFSFGSNTITEISNITFTGGSDPYANRQAISSSGKLTVRNCLFTNATGGGFAEYITINGNGAGYIYDSNFTETKSPYKEGYRYSNAAVFVTGVDARAYLDNCRFENNGYIGPEYTGPDAGIAVYNAHGGEAAFRVMQGQIAATNCYFANNTGVSMVYSNGLINYTNCIIRDSSELPALEISSYGRGYTVDNCTFINNTKGAIGIGLSQFIANNDVIIKNSKFYNNSAEKGGAIRLDKAGALIENCYFEGNNATDGGSIYNSYASLVITHCEFKNSSATGKGGSIYTEGDQDFIEIDGNLFDGSQADIGGVIYSNGITTLFNNEMHNGIANNGSYIYNDNRIGNTYIKISENKTYDVYACVEVTINATLTDDMANPITGGNVIFIIDGTEIPVFAQEGAAELNYVFGANGTYYVDGNYSGNRRYLTEAAGATYEVSKLPTVLEGSDVKINIGENGVFSVILKDMYGTPIPNKNIAVTFGEEILANETDENGIAVFNLDTASLKSGTYDISAEFETDDSYEGSTGSNNVYVKGSSFMTIVKIDGNMIIEGVLKDANGAGIANAVINYTSGDVISSVLTNDEGLFTISDIKNGLTQIFFEGNDIADENSFNITLSNIDSAVNPDKAFELPADNSPTPTYSINLPSDATGNFTVFVNGEAYETKSLVNGSASIVVDNLTSGTYNITVSYSGDDKFSPISKNAELTVPKPVVKLTNNKNINMLYTAGTKYAVCVTENDKPVSGAVVTFYVNGKKLTAKTDKNGYAGVAINLPPKAKAYTVTASYAGKTVKNTVKVKSIIKAKNIKVKKSKKVTKIKVSLKKVNGKFLKGKTLKLKIKNKTLKAKTNKKGVATFKLKKSVVKKLKVGKKYKFKVTYLKDKVTKKMTIKK